MENTKKGGLDPPLCRMSNRCCTHAIIVNFVVWDEHFAHFKGAFKNVLRILKIAMPDTFYIAMHETFLTNQTIPIDIDEPSK